MADITLLHPSNDADHVLDQAKGEYSELIIIGWDKDGFLDFRSNGVIKKDVLWFLEKVKHKMLSGDYDD